MTPNTVKATIDPYLTEEELTKRKKKMEGGALPFSSTFQ